MQGFGPPPAEKTLDIYEQASREGWGSSDCVKLPAFWSSRHSS